MGDRCSVPLTEKRGGTAAGPIKDGGNRRDGKEELVKLDSMMMMFRRKTRRGEPREM